jgi:hypothetical protein
MKSIIFLVLLTIVFVLSVCVSAAIYPISWTPETVQQTLGLRGSSKFTVTFVSNTKLENVDLMIAPDLQPFMALDRLHLDTLLANTSYPVGLYFYIPFRTQTGLYRGTIQLRAGSTTYFQILKIELHIVDASKIIEHKECCW